MQPGISTHAFFDHRLRPGHLDALAASGARTIEVVAARHHFDYTDPQALRETAAWFRSNDVRAVLYQPIYLSDRADAQWSRHVAPNLNLIGSQKTSRVAAMDEVKRAIESAEQIPFTAVVLRLGLNDTPWDEAALDNCLGAIEHLKAFASPLGVRILLENLQNDVATPELLLYILKTGHFSNVGVCLDIGHLHLTAKPRPATRPGGTSEATASSSPEVGSFPGQVAETIALLGSRIGQIHVHDNHGPFALGGSPGGSGTTDMKDEHLWPGEGTIDWPAIVPILATLPDTTPFILEPACDRDEPTDSITRKAENVFRSFADQQAALAASNL